MKYAKPGEWTTIYSYQRLTNSPKAIIIREIDLGGIDVSKELCFCGSGKKHKSCHHEVKENSAMAYLFEAFRIINDDLKSETLPECKKGCQSCCENYFDISPVEYFNILNFIEEKRTRKFIRRAYRNAQLNPPSFKPLLNDNQNPANFPSCIFVDNRNGKCKIYEARPLLCRLYGYYEQFTDCHKVKNLLQFHDDEHISNLLGDIATKDGMIRLPAMPIVYWFGNEFMENKEARKSFSELYLISQEKSLNTYVKFIIDNSDIFSKLFSPM